MNKLKKLIQCPFTWDIDEHFIHEVDQRPEIEKLRIDNEYPVMPFIQSIVMVYDLTIKNEDEMAAEELKNASDRWNQLKDRKEEIEREGVSAKVILHVMEATKYFFCTKQGKTLEAENILTDLQDAHNFKSKRELATIYGFKSITHSCYFRNIDNSTFAARIAVALDPDSPIWQFLLARELRKLRRKKTSDLPCREEVDAIEKSYRLSKNPYYGIHLAMVYRENEEYNKAYEMYTHIYNLNPENPIVQLRLALGFIRARDFVKAKECLDCAEITIPTSRNRMFLHYKGIYYQKLQNHEMAVKYFKEASENSDRVSADLQYAESMLKLNKNFDYLQFLEDIQEKYAADEKVKLRLHTGIMYYYMEKDIYNSLGYLMKTIESNPKNHNRFKNYYDQFTRKRYDLFDFINNTLLPEYEQKYGHAPQGIVETLRQLEKVCSSTS